MTCRSPCPATNSSIAQPMSRTRTAGIPRPAHAHATELGASAEDDDLPQPVPGRQLVHRVIDVLEPNTRGDQALDRQPPLAPHPHVFGNIARGYGRAEVAADDRATLSDQAERRN